MARAPLTFRQRDLTAAIKAIKAAGDEVVRVEVEAGRVVLIPSRGEAIVLSEPKPANPWDDAFDEGDVALRP